MSPRDCLPTQGDSATVRSYAQGSNSAAVLFSIILILLFKYMMNLCFYESSLFTKCSTLILDPNLCIVRKYVGYFLW